MQTGNEVLEVLETKTDDSNDDWLDNDGDNENNPGLINWCNQQNKEEGRSDCDSELNKTKHITIFRLQVLPVQLLVTKERKQVSLEAVDEEENVKKDTIRPSRLSSSVLRTPLQLVFILLPGPVG